MRKFWAPLGLVLFALILAFLNYQPHTWLTGWDNLHPEFNFGIDIKRSFFALWQEYRGLGLVGGMAHASDLPRQLILWGASLVLPSRVLRYAWTFAMLILGPLGTYYLATNTLLKRFAKTTRTLAGFFAGLFYLLNLATVQNFYTPFETFTSFYGFFPWLLYLITAYLEHPSRKRFLGLVFTLFLATPAFYTQTLFLVFLLCLVPLFVSFFISKRTLYAFKHLVWVSISILLINAYWLFPVIYFTTTHSSVPLAAVQNQVATREIIARNQEFATLPNAILLKGFWFEYVDLVANNRFGLMMGPWVSHLQTPAIQGIGYILFVLVLIGILYALKRRLHWAGAFLGIFLISLLFLLGFSPNFPLLHEAFRSVFTKWSIVAALGYSLFFSIGVIFLLDLFSFLHYRFTPLITAFTLILGLIMLTAPAFQGNLIYPAMRQNIPAEYFDLFAYLQTQDPNTRLMNLPQHTFWGWEFYRWGYRGSGLLWYGLEQPVLDRAFDVWSPYSESYYTQVQHAIYAQSLPELEALWEKYGITWVLVDDNLIVPGSDSNVSLYLTPIKQLLDTSSKATLVKDFETLHLYRIKLESQPQTFVVTAKTPAFSPLESYPATPPATLIDTPLQNHSSSENRAHNCDNFNATAFSQTNTSDSIHYSATHANACDHFLYPQLSHAFSYQFKITHRTLTGSPFFVCLEDYVSKQCLIYRYLPTSSTWTTTTLDIPTMKSDEYGYTLHLYSYSLNHQPSTNELKQIEIIPGPVKTPVKLDPLAQPLVRVETVQKDTYSLYSVQVDAGNSYGLFVLNQSFDKGWKVYQIDGLQPNNLITKYLLTLIRMPLPENHHLPIHDWANGWLIPSGRHLLLVVYQPQLWQFLGFVLLPVPGLIGLILRKK